MLLRFLRQWRNGPGPRNAGHADEVAQTAVRRVIAAPKPLDVLRAVETAGSQFESRWRETIKRRAVLVLGGLGLWTIGVEARLVHLQILRHQEMAALAVRQQKREIPLIPPRGDIVDRHGQMLAYSVDGHALVADPTEIEQPEPTAAQLCQALGNCTREQRAALLRSLTRRGSFAYLDRQVSPDQAARLEALKLPGIRIIPEPRRYYPKLDLASHVLGFVGVDNEGLGGIERTYDTVIRGTQGRMLLQVDARRKRLDSRVQQPPTPGATVELTLDVYLQHIAERELRAGIEASRALAGTAIVMDPYSGEILALASYPTFNPNAVQQFGDDARRDRAIQDVYEPGSTFKFVTASAALEDGILHLDDVIDTNPGVITFPGRKPITEDKHHNYGALTVEDVVVKSSNVGAIKIGLRVGPERMNRYIQRFGFGQALLPDLAGQSRGIVWSPSKLNDSAVASISMGYQVGVTPLQMATAASVIASGGVLYEPHLVRAIIRDDRRDLTPAKALRRVISSETAALLTTIMEGVVERGTGKQAGLDGYQVAGKTGTAARLANGRYSTSEYNVSFVGFVPSRQPVLTILVVIDTPRNGSPYGGTVAAPVFRKIAEASLRQLAIPPTIDPPPVILAGDTSAVQPRQIDGPAARPPLVPLGGPPVMPDVRGFSARDAVRVVSAAGLSVRLNGSGTVVSQTPPPGALIESGGGSVLGLRRAARDAGSAR